MERSQLPTRLLRNEDDPDDGDQLRLTPEQRVDMMWALALDAWAFKGDPVAEPRLPRHVVRVIRGGC